MFGFLKSHPIEVLLLLLALGKMSPERRGHIVLLPAAQAAKGRLACHSLGVVPDSFPVFAVEVEAEELGDALPVPVLEEKRLGVLHVLVVLDHDQHGLVLHGYAALELVP